MRTAMMDLRSNGVEVACSQLSMRNHKARPCSLMLPVRPDNIEQALSVYREAGFAGGYDGLLVSGFRDLTFLAEFPDLLYLEVLDGPTDARHLEPLHNLRGLHVSEPKSGIDFSWFPQLEVFTGKWHADHRNLADLQELRRLRIGALQSPSDDLSAIAGITRLDHLQLGRAKIRSLDGVETLEDLQILDVHQASKLESLAALERGVPGLRELSLEKCKQISTYDPIAKVERLRRLRISECAAMPDLQWTHGMDYLDFFSFVETDVADGDLSPLLGLPRLRYVGSMNKRKYSHTCEQLMEQLEQRRNAAG